jgi:hypothetical protein
MTEQNTTQDDEMNCGLTLAERDVLQMKLREMADTMPPRAVWNRIEEQARAEGLLKKPGMPEAAKWFTGIGLAAAVVLAVIISPNSGNRIESPTSTTSSEFPTEPAYSASANDVEARQYQSINALMVQSQLLERDLRALPEEPLVRRAGTIATISGLQDRIAAIDYQLNHAESRMTPQQQEVFWRERVRLMDSLVQLRYAQARRTSF